MPVSVRWLSENKILMVEYTAPFTIEARRAASAQMIAYFDAASRPVHIIGDWRRAGEWPATAGVSAESLDALSHQNMGWLAVVGMSDTLENWISVFAQLSGLHYFVVSSVEEAARKLRSLE